MSSRQQRRPNQRAASPARKSPWSPPAAVAGPEPQEAAAEPRARPSDRRGTAAGTSPRRPGPKLPEAAPVTRPLRLPVDAGRQIAARPRPGPRRHLRPPRGRGGLPHFANAGALFARTPSRVAPSPSPCLHRADKRDPEGAVFREVPRKEQCVRQRPCSRMDRVQAVSSRAPPWNAAVHDIDPCLRPAIPA